MTTNDSKSLFDQLAAGARTKHADAVSKAQSVSAAVRDDETVVAQVSLPRGQKVRLTRLAKGRGLSFSAFVRLACEDYAARNGWE